MFSHQLPLLFLESIGTGEVLVIVFVIIIFFGGKKIPEMARVIGKGMREFKAAANNIQDEIQKSVTEIERSVNVESALRDDQPMHKPETPQGSIVKEQAPSPQLIRSDDPEPKTEHPAVPPVVPPQH
jgi:TatA/E family protein of Tat protein translocase